VFSVIECSQLERSIEESSQGSISTESPRITCHKRPTAQILIMDTILQPRSPLLTGHDFDFGYRH
jgi:hypothetical protein